MPSVGAANTVLIRKLASVTLTGLAPNTATGAALAMGPSWLLVGLRTSAPARVRLYTSTAAASADSARAVTADPSTSAGLFLEYVTADATAVAIAPAVVGAPVGAGSTAATVTNQGSTTVDMIVECTYVSLEAGS
jgi:hypothetical protein